MKWDSMRAYIGAPQGFVPDDEGEHEGLWQDYVEFFMQVLYRDQVFYNRILIHRHELRDFPGLYKLTLDKMVESIENHIKEKFPMSTKTRSTIVTLKRSECLEVDSVQRLVRDRAQLWLDELAKDDVAYDKVIFEMLDQIGEDLERDEVRVRVSVNVVESPA